MKSVLITGAAGFVGYHLACRLAERQDIKLVLVDNYQRGRNDTQFEELLKKDNVFFYQIDLCVPNSLDVIKEAIDEVYHLAAVVGVKHCVNRPDFVLKTNILSTVYLIDFIKARDIKKLLFSSTCETYASGFDLGIIQIPTPEVTPLVISDITNPRWSYAGSKIVGEQMVLFNAKGNYDYKIVRYHNIFGPRMGFVHIIPEIVKRVANKESPFRLFGKDQTRSFCYVNDAVTQTILAMEKCPSGTYHVGNGKEEISIGEVINLIFSELEYKPESIIDENAPEGSVNRRCPDTSKLWSETNFTPEYSFKEGLKETVQWYWKETREGEVWE